MRRMRHTYTLGAPARGHQSTLALALCTRGCSTCATRACAATLQTRAPPSVRTQDCHHIRLVGASRRVREGGGACSLVADCSACAQRTRPHARLADPRKQGSVALKVVARCRAVRPPRGGCQRARQLQTATLARSFAPAARTRGPRCLSAHARPPVVLRHQTVDGARDGDPAKPSPGLAPFCTRSTSPAQGLVSSRSPQRPVRSADTAGRGAPVRARRARRGGARRAARRRRRCTPQAAPPAAQRPKRFSR